MKEEKISFLKKVIICIKDFEKYLELAASNVKTTLLYLMKLIAIFTIVVTGIFIYGMSVKVNSIYNYIEKEISQIDYDDGILQISNNEPIIIENNTDIINTIIIDTSDVDKLKEEEYIQKVQDKASGMVFLKEKILLKADMSNAIVTYSYKELSETYGIQYFDKTYILEQFTGTNVVSLYIVMFLIAFFYLYIIYVVDVLVNILLLAAIGYFTAIILRLRLKYSAICNIASYSLTLPILLNVFYVIINYFTGFEIEYFNIMYIGISYIYIITSILLIKADMIKKGRELAKIIEEQEKVRQEIERKQEEERRKEEERKEQERREKEEEKKKEKEEKNKQKKGKIGTEPQGDNV